MGCMTQSRVIHVTSVEQFKELQQKGKDTKRSVRLTCGCPLQV